MGVQTVAFVSPALRLEYQDIRGSPHYTYSYFQLLFGNQKTSPTSEELIGHLNMKSET